MEHITNSFNPVLTPAVHIPDCEGHVVYHDQLFVFGSEDRQDNAYCSKEFITASTPDMEHWTVYDPIFDSSQCAWHGDGVKYPGGVDWSKPSPYLKQMFEENKKNGKVVDYDHYPTDVLYAPDVIEKNGKFYLFFPLSDDSEGVAVADQPQGPYHDPVRLHINGIDPSVFIDDDGQAYIYWGQFYSHAAKLSDDMMSVREDTIHDNVLTEDEHHFHEGSSVRKIGDTYYYVYASISHGSPCTLDYATGPTPFGPFTYCGTIISNDGCNPGNWNIHGSIGKFKNQWYVFYHRSSRGNEYHRRLCIEPITIEDDGSIKEVPMTSQGVGDPLGVHQWISAYRFCKLSGKCNLKPTADGNEKLTDIADNDTALIRYFAFDDVPQSVTITGQGTGIITLLMNGVEIGHGEMRHGSCKIENFHLTDQHRVELELRFNRPDKLAVEALRID